MNKKLVFAICVTFLLTALVTTVVNVYRYERTSFREGVVISKMYSEILGERRELIVHLPQSYHRDLEQRFPVVYVLDGSSQDFHTAYGAALMARIGVIPELIVVGLPNTSGDNRQRDYTPPLMRRDIDEPDSPLGEGDKFLAFLKNEVMPRIEGKYRTDRFRMLAGNSRGACLSFIR